MTTFLYDRLVFPPVRLVGRVFFKVYSRLRVELSTPIPSRGPVILVANHESALDGILLHAVCPRPLRIFIAGEWVDWPYLRWLFVFIGAIRVDRDRQNRRALEDARDWLGRGHAVALFPEGTIPDTPELGPFRNGAARLALLTGAPIYPCAIIGTRRAQPWPRLFPSRARVTVRSGSPLRFAAESEDEDHRPEALAAATHQIRQAVRALLEEGLAASARETERSASSTAL